MQSAQVVPITDGKPKGPQSPGEWTISQIQEALKRPLPSSMIEQRKQGGVLLDYVPWHVVNRILDKYAPGWTWEIVNLQTTADRIFLTGRLTIPASDGSFHREATGTELLKSESTKSNPRNNVSKNPVFRQM